MASFRFNFTKRIMSNHSDSPEKPSEPRRRIPLWQALVIPVAAIVIFLFLLEGGLALLGVKPALQTEDPFVGFASNVPLFVPAPKPAPGGGQLMVTAANKQNYFNIQSFPRQKRPGTYRIFCLGGSTTYGRPYNDATSFSGWLRALLPKADDGKEWEVINAGGISYASYRAAHLMEELVNYQPDLFIIYTGHNEFLEEITYHKLRNIPPVVQSAVSLLAETRTWAAMTTALKRMGIYPQSAQSGKRTQLAGEVTTILDRSVGPKSYTRDDKRKQNVLEHYRISLERMVALARSAGAKIVFVTPASNLKDCSPFKSEHTNGLDQAARQRSEQMLATAKEAIRQKDWAGALATLDQAAAFDPRDAELLYRRGKVLLALKRYDEALTSLQKARDEDVCPLRALTPMRGIVTEVAQDQGAGLVDFINLLAQRMQDEFGYPIPGKEYFLDHVHPTIEGNKILALALVRNMADQGIVHPGKGWGQEAIAAVTAAVEGKVDRQAHGQALANLARVLLWAGKDDDAAELAQQAFDIAGEYRQVAVDSASILTSYYERRGNMQGAVQLLYSALEKAPGAIDLRLKLGRALLQRPFLQPEKAAANLLLVCQQMPDYDMGLQLFGLAMAKLNRPRIAYPNLLEALRLNPNNSGARITLARVQPLLSGQTLSSRPARILLDVYPSLAPRGLMQVRRDSRGRPVPDGIKVEWYENGRLKHYQDYDLGVPDGFELTWDPEGKLLSRVEYRNGLRVGTGKE